MGAAATTVASALGRPARVRAGTDGDVVLGAISNAPMPTWIANTYNNNDVLIGQRQGAGIGVKGESASGVGVWGSSGSGTSGMGVCGSSGSGCGVSGGSGSGFAVQGDSNSGVGVAGSSPVGTGVRAESSTGTALDVRGKARFSRSKKVTIGAGKSSLKVTLAGVTTSSLVFAVLHSNRSGVYVRAVVPSTGSFTIYLNKAATAATYVGLLRG